MGTSNDLQTCVQLLSRMLDKDSGAINTRGGVLPKRKGAVPNSIRPFLTTGRIVKGTIASSGKRSDTESKKTNTGKTVPGRKYSVKHVPVRSSKRDLELCENVQKEGTTSGSKSKGSNIIKSCNPSSRAAKSRLQRADPESLLNTTPFNQRLTSSTPSSTPTRLVERDGAIMLNSSTGTQVINTTNDVFAARPASSQRTTSAGPRLVRGQIDFTPYPENSPNNVGVWTEELPNANPGISKDMMNINLNNNYSLYTLPESPQISPTKNQLMLMQKQKASIETSSLRLENNINEASKTALKIKPSFKTDAESKSSEGHDIASDREFFTFRPTICRDRFEAERKRFNQNSSRRHLQNAKEPSSHRNDNNVQHLQPSKSLFHTYPYEHLRTYNDMQSLSSQQSDSVRGSNHGGGDGHYRFLGNKDCAPLKIGDLVPNKNEVITKDGHYHSVGNKDFTPLKIDDLVPNNNEVVTKNGHRDEVNVFRGSVVQSGAIMSKRNDASTLLSRLKDIISEDKNSEINKLISELQDVVQVQQDVKTTRTLFVPDTASELSDNSTSTRDLLISASQHFKERDVTARKLNTACEVSHSDSTDLHLKQLTDLRCENDELRVNIKLMQEQIGTTEREKSNLLQVITKKDEDHMKSLQEKARDIRLVHTELDIIRSEKLDGDKRIVRLNDEIQRHQITIKEKEEESARCQELVRSLHQSTTRLVQDLQNSRTSHLTPDCKHVVEDTLRMVERQLDQTRSVMTCELNGHTSTTQPVKNLPQAETTNVLPVPRETLASSNSLRDNSSEVNLSPKQSVELFQPSNVVEVKNDVQLPSVISKVASSQPNVSKSQVFHAHQPRIVSNVRHNHHVHHGVASEDDSNRANIKIKGNGPQNVRGNNHRRDNVATLTEYDDDHDRGYSQNIDHRNNVADSSSIDQSRHSMTEYFRKYPSTVETTNKQSSMPPPTKHPDSIKDDFLKRNVLGSSRTAFEFVSHPTDQESSFSVASFISMDEPRMSIRMSDFSEDEDVYSDELPPHQSSDVDGDHGRLEESMISPIQFHATPSSSVFFQPVVVRNRSDSVASLSSVTSSEDLAFRDGLASLDANIARIQQQLKASLPSR